MPTKLETQLREKFLTLSANILQITEKNPDDVTADEKQNVRTMTAELETVENDWNEARKTSQLLDKRAQFEVIEGGRVSGVVAQEEQPTQKRESRLAKFGDSDQLKEYRRNPAGKSDPFPVGSFREERAVIYGGALAADMVRPQLLPGIQRPNEAIGVRAMRDVLLGGRTTSDSIMYILENVFTNAAATVSEATASNNGAKPESSLTFTQTSDPVEVIAHWIPITRQALDDVPQLQSYVEGRLFDGLVRVENDQLLNGNGTAPNISGILDRSGIQNLDQTYFTGAAVKEVGTGMENFNRILRGKTLIATTGDSMATFVAMSPAEWESLITTGDANDNYYGMGPFAGADAARLWGLDVVQTEAKAAGSYLVGDGTAAQVWDRWDARILIADQHSDFFIRNLLVLLAEERLGLSVYRPAAFALVDAA